ncbi:MAG: YIP1 family protein [Gemmatimonadota bacterium]|nr:YIP1 family protein [Gemmatimonadota bacterium]
MSEPGDRPPRVDPVDRASGADGERPPVVGLDEPPADRSAWANARDVFVAPSRTFRDVREDPRILPPLLFLVAAGALAMTFVMVVTGPPDAMERMLEDAGLPGGSFGTVAITFFAVVSVAITAPLVSALVASLLWAWSTLRDGVTTFAVAFAAILWSRLVGMLETAANGIAMHAVDRGLSGVTIGPSLVVPPDQVSGPLYGALMHLNVFSIWVAVLTAWAGIHAMGLERRDAWLFAVVLWTIGLVFAMLGATMGGMEPTPAPSGPSL